MSTPVLCPGDVIRKGHFSTSPTLTVRAVCPHSDNERRLIYQYERIGDYPGGWDYVHIIDPMIGKSIVKVES